MEAGGVVVVAPLVGDARLGGLVDADPA